MLAFAQLQGQFGILQTKLAIVLQDFLALNVLLAITHANGKTPLINVFAYF